MKRLLPVRLATALGTTAALLASGGVAASAQAATVNSAVIETATTRLAPDFTCPSATVCLFPGDNYDGNYPYWGGPAELPTSEYRGKWTSFSDTTVEASNPNPGSIHINANSVMWVYDEATGMVPVCYAMGKHVLDHSYGWFYIQYGYTACPSQWPTPLP